MSYLGCETLQSQSSSEMLLCSKIAAYHTNGNQKLHLSLVCRNTYTVCLHFNVTWLTTDCDRDGISVKQCRNLHWFIRRPPISGQCSRTMTGLQYGCKFNRKSVLSSAVVEPAWLQTQQYRSIMLVCCTGHWLCPSYLLVDSSCGHCFAL